MSIGLQVLKIYIQHLIEGHSTVKYLQTLQLCSKTLKSIVDDYYHTVKVYAYDGDATMATQWLLIPKRSNEWEYRYNTRYVSVSELFSVIFVFGNIQFAFFAHNPATWRTIICQERPEIAVSMTCNWGEFLKKKEDGVVTFTFTKKLKNV